MIAEQPIVSITNDFPHSRYACSNHRAASCHGLDQSERHAFVMRAQDRDPQMLQSVRDISQQSAEHHLVIDPQLLR